MVPDRGRRLIVQVTVVANTGGYVGVFINSSGLGALVSILKDVRNSQGTMKLTNLAPYVKEIFDITQMSNIFDIFPDENQALSSF